jgi:C-terminal peptidase prc
MAHGQMDALVRYVRNLAGAPPLEPTDRDLLERFARVRDEDAFSALVRRHGPLVWGVCRRVLESQDDAEDVFQATFFVLARKAGDIHWQDSVGSWLHEVAFRLSKESRVKLARRRFHESNAAGLRADASSPPRDTEVFDLLDEELHRLPTKYRAPILLCYLQGRTSDQAAQELGWSLRSLQRRLAQGREMLRGRLARRGVSLSSALLLGVLSQGSADAALPAALIGRTTETALSFCCGTASMVTPGTALAHAFVEGMAMTRWKLIAGVMLLVLTITGGGWIARQVAASNTPTPDLEQTASQKKTQPAESKPAKSEADEFAAQMWDILEVIGKRHFEPKPRAELIAAGINELRKEALSRTPDKPQTDEKLGPPQEFLRRAAAVKTSQEFADLLRPLWPEDPKFTRAERAEAFLKGVAQSIGGDIRLLPGQEMKIQEQLSGNRYVGIGIQIGMNPKEKRAQILVAMRRGTARAAGIKANDLIMQVDGKDTQDVSIQKVVEWSRGEEGTTVTFAVKQPGEAETRTYKMKRAIVPFDSLAGWRRASADEWNYQPAPDAPVAYVRIDSLRTSTLQELRQLEPKLRAQGFRALVLDFRFSQGDGMVRNAAIFADGLLDGGLMWTSRGTDEESRKEYRADRECMFRDWPIAMLINDSLDRQHALVAAALQDNKRAILVGQPTKNDGYVNTVVTLPDGKSGLIFRTGILERASKDRSWPVQPDHLVELDAKARLAIDQGNHKQETAEEPTNDQPPADPQLAKAVAVMRDALKKQEAKP